MDLNEVLFNTELMLRRLVGEDVAVAVSAGSAGHILADPGQLEQVVVNLVVNARDAMPAGGRIVLATADVRRDHRYFLLRVTDDGCGMDRETQEHIFEPFFTTKGVGEGTGLGLSVAYGIIKEHGGWIDVESTLGAGSCFRVYLPLEPTDD